MNILAMSDIHGAYDKMAAIVAENPPCDVIVIAGDLTTYGTTDEAERAVRKLESFNKPVVVVAGNMDPVPVETVLKDFKVSVDGRGVTVDGVGFFGVSACPFTPLKTPNEISEEEIATRAIAGWNDVIDSRVKVFIPHTPPSNTKLDVIYSGKHVGSSSVRSLVEHNQPELVICGHIHEARGVDSIGEAKMVNCGSAANGYYALICVELPEKGKPAIDILTNQWK